MNCECCANEEEIPRDCERCDTPKVEGHGVICALTWVADAAWYGAIVLLLLFWACLFIVLAKMLAGDFVEPEIAPPIGILAAVNSGLLFAVSITCGMRAKWLRHRIVSRMERYLDEDGSCCGGACAGSCGDADGGCGDEGCSPEGCDDADCCKRMDGSDDEEPGCCGGGCRT
jgi:hypothetical protein